MNLYFGFSMNFETMLLHGVGVVDVGDLICLSIVEVVLYFFFVFMLLYLDYLLIQHSVITYRALV